MRIGEVREVADTGAAAADTARRPSATVGYLAAASGVSYETTVRAVRTLTETGLLRELTGRRRGRVFAHDRYLAILSEGAQPL